MTWRAEPSGRRGGQAVYSDAAIRAWLTIKVLFGLPLRRTTGFAASLLRLAGLDRPVPDHSTLCRRQRTVKVMLPHRGSPGPVPLLVDVEPVSAAGSSEPARGHRGPRRGRMARAQAWRDPAPRLARGPPRARRGSRCGRSRSPQAMSATRPCCPTCSARSPRVRRSARSPPMAPDGHPPLPRRHRRARRPCRRAAPQERASLETRHTRRPGPQRRPAHLEASRPCTLAPPDRLPSSQPRRDQDELRQAPRPEAHGARLRPPRASRTRSGTAELQVRIATPNRFTAPGIPVTRPIA